MARPTQPFSPVHVNLNSKCQKFICLKLQITALAATSADSSQVPSATAAATTTTHSQRGGKATINSTSIKSSRPRSKREPTAAPRESRVPSPSIAAAWLPVCPDWVHIHMAAELANKPTADIVNVWRSDAQGVWECGRVAFCLLLLIMLLPASGLLPFACASYFKAVNTFQPNRKKCTTSPTEPQLWQKYSWHKFCTCLGASSTSCARVVILFSCARSGWVWCYDICLLRNKAPH